eukprot:850321_1
MMTTLSPPPSRLKKRASNKKANMINTDRFHHIFDKIQASSPLLAYQKGGHIYQAECEELDINIECYFSTAHISYYGVFKNDTRFCIDSIFILPMDADTNIIECSINSHNVIRTTAILRPNELRKTATIPTDTSNTNRVLVKHWCAEQMGLFSHQLNDQFRVPIFGIEPNQNIMIKIKCIQSLHNKGNRGFYVRIPLSFYHAQYPKYTDHEAISHNVQNGPPNAQTKFEFAYSVSAAMTLEDINDDSSHTGHITHTHSDLCTPTWSEYVNLNCIIYYPQRCQPKIFSSSHDIQLIPSNAVKDCITVHCGQIKASENGNAMVDHNVFGCDFEMMYTYYTPKLSQRSKSPLPPLIIKTGVNSDDIPMRTGRSASTVTYTESNKDGHNILQFEAHFILFKTDPRFAEEKKETEETVSGLLCVTAPRNSNEAPIHALQLKKKIIYVMDAQLIMESYWNQCMKAMVQSMAELTDDDLFNMMIIDADEVYIYYEDNVFSEGDEISKRKSREWIMVDRPQYILSKYADKDAENTLNTIGAVMTKCYKMLNTRDCDKDYNYLPVIAFITSSSFANCASVCNDLRSECSTYDIQPRIFSIGIGNSANPYFLAHISDFSKGKSLHIVNEHVIGQEMKHFLCCIEYCILCDICVEFSHCDASNINIYPNNICDLFYPSPAFMRVSIPKLLLDNDDISIKISGLDCHSNTIEMVIDKTQFATNRSAFPLHLLFLNTELNHSISQCWYYQAMKENTQLAEWINKTNAISDQYEIETPYQPLISFDIDLNTDHEESQSVLTHISHDYVNFETVLKEWVHRKQILSQHKNYQDIVQYALNNVTAVVVYRKHGAWFESGHNIKLSTIYDEAELHKLYTSYYKETTQCGPCTDCTVL